MAPSGCYGIARSVSRRAAAQPAREPHDRKPLLPSNQALRCGGALLQPKLRVSQPNEPAEREADAVAERIVARQSDAAAGVAAEGPVRLDRACAECDAELDESESIAREAVGSDEETETAAPERETDEAEEDEDIETMNDDSILSMKAMDGGGGASVPASVVPREAGSALAPGVRQSMESGFNAGLDHVRVHTGDAAAHSASRLNARAYTVGNHVYFGAGQYAPGSKAGTRLLAHELTHVLQQTRSGTARSLQRDDKDKPAKEEAKKAAPAATISRIDVDLGSQKMTITYSDNSTEEHTISSGKGKKGTKGDPCATQKEANCTPTGTFKIGYKRGANHENSKGDAMAWFVELTGDEVINGRGIGFHNSQTADGVPRSHGCIRVGKGAAAKKFAKKINEGVTADTTVVISGKAPTKAYGAVPKKKTAKKRAAPAKKKTK